MKNFHILMAARILASAKLSKVNGIVNKLAVSKLYNELTNAMSDMTKQIEDLRKRGVSEEELRQMDVELSSQEYAGDFSLINEEAFGGLVESNDFSIEQINIIQNFVQNGKEG